MNNPKSVSKFFSEVLSKANFLQSLTVVKLNNSRHSYRQFTRHLLLAHQWVKFADLTHCECPTNTTKKINLELLLSILDLAGFFVSIKEQARLESHIVSSYGENHIKRVKEFEVSPIHKMCFEHNNEWSLFLTKIKYFDQAVNEWALFEYLCQTFKNVVKMPVVSFEEGKFTTYEFQNRKQDHKVSFTVYENSVKITTIQISKKYGEFYEKIEKFTSTYYRYNKSFNNMVLSSLDLLGGR